MKKFYSFSLIFILVATFSIAQNLPQEQSELINKSLLPQTQNSSATSGAASAFSVIGTTTYDLQTNASSCNRISFSNGVVVATWNWSMSSTQTFPDRGTGYNFNDGLNWNPIPSNTIDSCAWPNIDIGANVEYVVGHSRPPASSDLQLLKRSPVGSGPWQKFALPPDPQGHQTLWPRMRVGGPNDSSIHVIALSKPIGNGGMLNNGIDGALTYSRSQDGGLSWDLLHTLLPGIDITNYTSMAPETYAIDVSGSTIAIVQGSLYNDWVLWKSIDNGSSWFRQIIKPFPIPAFDPQSMVIDIDGDGIADTVETIDGSHAVLIDNNGMVHCWSGRMMMMHDTPGQGVGYFPLTDGLMYWNESFMTAPPVMIAMMEDLDGDGIASPEPGTVGYSHSLTSMPSAGIDDLAGIFLAYSSAVENTDDGSGHSYRNVYVMHSNNNGTNWSLPFRLSPSDFDEQVYPSLPRNINSKLRLIYQQDGIAGISLNNGSPIGINDIMYFEDDTSQIFSGLNPNPSYYKYITGKLFGDSNQNKIFDGNDFPISNQPIMIGPANNITGTNAQGDFFFVVPSGNYTINYNVSPNWILTTDSLSYTVNVTNSNVSNHDFGIFPGTFASSGTMDVNTSIARCNATMTFWMNVVNTGTTQIQGHLKFVHDPQMSFLNSNPAVTSVVVDTFYWDLGLLSPFQYKTVSLNLSTAGLIGGTNIANCASFSLDNTFAITQDSCMNQTLVCAYDPNDKSVFPAGVMNQNYTLISDSLLYTIRFQNTGNDTAFTVRIRDTLNAFLDLSTFKVVSASHPVTFTMKPDRSVIFEFENILLPDSNVNEPGSNGFVKYRIHPLNGIPEGTIIENTAYIYFDYNPPIQTNTTLNTMVSTIGIKETDKYLFKLYPNPTNENVFVEFENQENETFILELTDISGKQILNNQMLKESPFIIQTDDLESGMYFLRIFNNSELISVGKIVKLNH